MLSNSLLSLPRKFLAVLIAFVFLFQASVPPAFAMTAKQKKLYNMGVYYYDLASCGAASDAGDTDTSEAIDGSVQDLAKQMLKNDKITYWTNSGVNTRGVVVALSEGKKGYTTAPDGQQKEANVNPNILKFILEAAKDGSIMVNALTDKDHSSGSNHYEGLAVDLDNNAGNTTVSVDKLISIAKEYGGEKNSETTHHHFDFLKRPAGGDGGSGSSDTSSGGAATEESGSTGGCKCGGGGDVNLVGSEIAEKIFNFFVSQDLKPYMAAGIMGNMNAESTLNPRIVQDGGEADEITVDGVTGYGLVQWTTAGRQQGLKDAAKKAGKKSSALEVQLAYVMTELSGSHKSAGDNLKKTKNVEEATLVIELQYEIHAGGVQPQRTADAKGYLAKYGSGSGGGGSSGETSCSEGESGEVTGEYSLPHAKKWYKEHPEYFTGPHHGDPNDPGVDIPVPGGTPTYSITAGKIIEAPYDGGYGRGVLIEAPNGVQYVYGHGSDGGSVRGAKKGDTVKPGQLIMHVNDTGSSRGNHLHLSILVNGKEVCPQKFLVSIAEGKPLAPKSLPSSGCTPV